jgi:PAS domain S-box-containing protein
MPNSTPYLIGLIAVVVVMAAAGSILLYREESRYRRLLKIHAAMSERAKSFETWANSLDNGASQAIVTVDPRGLICGYNPAAAKLFGYPQEEILRQSIFRLIPTDGNTAGASGDVVESLAGREVEAIHCDGTRLSVRLRIAQIKFDNEARFRFFFEELTGEQRQQELQNENQLLRTVLDSTGLVVARLSPQGRILQLSRACADLLEVSPASAEGRVFWELFQKREHWAQARTWFERAKNEAKPSRLKAEWITRTQRVVPLEWLILAPARSDRGELTHVMAIAEAAGPAGEVEHQRTLKTMERVVGRIARQFENLLSTINGYSELVHHELAAANPLRKDIEQIMAASQQASGITQQLVSFSGNRIMLLENVNLDSFVVLANREALQEVLAILATYGFTGVTTFTPIAETRSTHTGDLEPGDYVSLKMSMGKTLDPEMLAQFFEPFGSGQDDAGLAMVHGMIRSFGGGISVANLPDEGTTLEIFLPAIVRPGERPVATGKSTTAVSG